MDKWDRILRPENIVVGMRSTRKLDALRELAAVLEDDVEVPDPKQFLADLVRREQRGSTGIGNGVAIPHCHEETIRRQILAIGISREGIAFDAVDGAPVHVMAILGTPQKHQKQHMELLAALSRLLQDGAVRASLVAAANAGEVLEIFRAGPA